MEIKVKTLNEDGSLAFDGVLREHELSFVIEVGVNFLLSQGMSPFIQDEGEDLDETVVGPGTTSIQ